jgi:carbon monoxide dehydrogenase subunit G
MELEHEFTVPLDVARTWSLLQDPRQVAYHLPGACLTKSRDDDTVTGTLEIGMGPTRTTYVGEARLLDLNEAVHRMVVRATGRDTRGLSTATATMTVTLTPDVASLGAGPRTVVHVLTDFTITGPPALLSPAILQDTGTWLVTQFARSVAGQVGQPPGALEEPTPAVVTGRSRTRPAPLRSALLRYGPWVAVAVAGALLVRRPARATTFPTAPRGLVSATARRRVASRGSRLLSRIRTP